MKISKKSHEIIRYCKEQFNEMEIEHSDNSVYELLIGPENTFLITLSKDTAYISFSLKCDPSFSAVIGNMLCPKFNLNITEPHITTKTGMVAYGRDAYTELNVMRADEYNEAVKTLIQNQIIENAMEK